MGKIAGVIWEWAFYLIVRFPIKTSEEALWRI